MTSTPTRRGLTAEQARVIANHLAMAEGALRDAADTTFYLTVLVHQHLDELPASWALLPDSAKPDDNGTSLVAIAERIHRHVAKAWGLMEVLAVAVRFEVSPFLPADDEDGEADETE